MQQVTTYAVHACPNASCGVEFAVTAGYDDRRRDDGRSFYCPNGHSMSYTDSTERQLKRERDKTARLTSQLDQARADRDAIERSRRATKGQLTKVRTRIARGVCPCCNRTFENLADHMTTKHPAFAVSD